MTANSNVFAALRSRRLVAPLLAILITIYGGLLRLDSYVGKYGPLNHPAWARIATNNIAPLVASIRPSRVHWTPEPRPYVGGDPITYIEYGRDMRSFYEPHVREPVFRAMTHAGLWALDDQDAGVSLASAAGSTLSIFATYLVGAALLSPAAGLVAAALSATELEMVTWGVDGWRDDTFTTTVLLSVWAMLRLRRRPSLGNAVLVGLTCGASCLTRITAFTFIVPALIWLLIDHPPSQPERPDIPRRLRAQMVAIAAALMTAVVAPYLISCAIATGDPLIAINYHTAYYRFAEERPIDKPMSAAEYLRGKFAERPLRTLDTGVNGLVLQPFVTKWNGFEEWVHGARTILIPLAIAGLAAMPFFGSGRLVLVALLGSLLPYIFTWNVGGGGAWRFTMHAYPFFLVAVGVAVVGAGRVATSLWRGGSLPRARPAALVWRIAAILAAAGGGLSGYFGMPWLVIREAIAHKESTSIEVGARDRIFYRSGWSALRVEGIPVRYTVADRATIRLPLPERRAYDLVLRLDPVTAASPESVDVLFNRHLIGRVRLSWNPERVGSYRLQLREDIVNAGSNEIIVIPSSVTPASAAGPKLAWLNPADPVGIRLWYVRVIP
jgi:hypothetical protein